VGVLYHYQCSLIYPASFPEGSRSKVDLPSEYGMPYEDVALRTKDNVKIRAYVITRDTEAQTQKADTLLYLHANAGNMGHRLPLAKRFYDLCQCNIVMLSYRGYGLSEGSPSEKGMRIDAGAILEFIEEHALLRGTRVVLFGQSIGGAVAINLAARYEDKIHGMILENTFLSLPELIPYVMPIARPFAALCHQIWDSGSEIRKIRRVHALFLASAKDTLIPPTHFEELYNRLDTTGVKKRVILAEGTHNDACVQPGYWAAIESF
ncbi:Alpha/Beta hydrolase protein, partial [Piptocephalis cylindrospora]